MAITAAAFLPAASELPFLPAAACEALAPLVVLAPHPDDESLACGGLIALLRGRGLPVHVMAVSDGAASHPGSREYPPERLRALRAEELRAATAELGLGPEAISFLGLPDSLVPHEGELGFADALGRLDCAGGRLPPRTVLTSWRYDPHTDHAATYELARAWGPRLRPMPRLLEYVVWGWRLPAGSPVHETPPCGFRVDTRSVVALKRRAIERHGSQLGRVVTDDPTGFRLDPDMVASFVEQPELFLEMPP
jgi:LmbE family N-acetylglucosaminyl deacetylase